ncbi:MAG: 3-oxoacyl-ACP reductase FabG [Syntrophobacteraceae bacterium]|nr:3-oxoacyl-ACP reductase FabG [Syntrophobacteraceae bacterium]
MDDLHGKVALVTGAGRGIGRAIARAMAEAGADVAVHYFSHEKEAVETLAMVVGAGRRGIVVQADVSSSSQISEMIEAVERGLGTVQILVNNAGTAIRKSLAEVTEQDWDRVMAVNLKSAFLLIQAVFQRMCGSGWGRIVNISSTAAQTGGITAPPYVASKAGLWGLSHCYATQLITCGVTVNTVAPALIETDMVRDIEAKPGLVPIGRFGAPEEVGDAVLMLVRNGYITGQTINANGGRILVDRNKEMDDATLLPGRLRRHRGDNPVFPVRRRAPAAARGEKSIAFHPPGSSQAFGHAIVRSARAFAVLRKVWPSRWV